MGTRQKNKIMIMIMFSSEKVLRCSTNLCGSTKGLVLYVDNNTMYIENNVRIRDLTNRCKRVKGRFFTSSPQAIFVLP